MFIFCLMKIITNGLLTHLKETPTENSTKDQNVSGNDQDGGSRDSKNNSAVCDVKDGSASSPELSPLDSPADQPRKPECLAKEGGAGDCTSPRSSVGGSGKLLPG